MILKYQKLNSDLLEILKDDVAELKIVKDELKI